MGENATSGDAVLHVISENSIFDPYLTCQILNLNAKIANKLLKQHQHRG